MEEEKQEIKKQFIFNGKDFNNWKFRMEILLREHDAEDFITKSLEEFEEIAITNLDDETARTRKAKLRDELRKKERKCYSLLVQRIGNDYLEYVKDKANPKEAWSSMCTTFERKGVSNRMFLRRELLSLKMKENEQLENHLLKFNKIVRQLKAVGANMEDEDVICQLLLSLPKTFDQVVTALETMKAEDLTMEFVKGRLLDCELKRQLNILNEKHSEEHPTAMLGSKNKVVTCYLCGKKGHYQSECPQNKRVKNCNCSCNNNQNHNAHLVEEQVDDSDCDF